MKQNKKKYEGTINRKYPVQRKYYNVPNRIVYKIPTPETTSINLNQSVEGETIEAKVRRVLNNKEPIKDGAPIIYTDRKDGVHPMHDVRTDKWEIAAESQDTTAANRIGQRTPKPAAAEKGEGGEASTIAGTGPDTAA